MKITVINPAGVGPVSLETARDHLRVDSTDEDAYIAGLILAATSAAEAYSGLRLMTQTLEVRYDTFPADGVIKIPACPVQSITSVQYYDADGVQQTLSASTYWADTHGMSPRVIAKGSFPAVEAGRPSAVTVRFVAGYADPALVPDGIKQAVLLTLGHFYENREAVQGSPGAVALEVPMTTKFLLDQFGRPVIA